MEGRSFPSIPFDEAVRALRRRGTNLFPSEHWTSVWQEQHQAGFTVARSAGFDIVKDIHTALVDAMERGRTFDDFKRGLIPVLQKKGWWGDTTAVDPKTGERHTVRLGSVRRLETIFDTNMSVSFAEGRWEQQQAVKDAFPYLRYTGILDSRIRPQHRRWHGTILPIDHPWWRTHYPPNGWKCRCDAMSVSLDDMRRYGWKVSGAPEGEGPTTWINPATGDVVEVPDGIDPGWAYNPGNTDRAAQLAKLAMDKLVTLPAEVGAAAVAELAFAFPQVERELGGWLEGVARGVTEDAGWYPRGERRVVGCLDGYVIGWLAANANRAPETAAITIADAEIMHLVRTAKRERGNALSVGDVRRLPSLLREPDAVYWDNGGQGEQKRDEGLIYVWLTPGRGAGKLIIRINFKDKMTSPEGKGRVRITTNAIRSGRLDIDPQNDLHETKGYIKIKGNL